MFDLTVHEKLALADRMGRELAHEKTAGLLGSTLGKAMHAAVGTGLRTRAAVGAGIGAAAGAAKHMMAPKQVQQDGTIKRQGSLLGSMAGGAAIGTGLGAGARAGAQAIGSMNNRAGAMARSQLIRQAKGSGNATALAAGQQMRQTARATQQAAKGVVPAAAAPAAAAQPKSGGFLTSLRARATTMAGKVAPYMPQF